MVFQLFGRLNLILFSWSVLLTILWVHSAHAQEPSRINEHMLNTHTELERDQTKTRLENHFAPTLKESPEFIAPNPARSYGVDMQMAPTLPNFEFDTSYVPTTLEAQIQKEIQEEQTTDYVVEQTWRDIRKRINSENQRR